MVACACAPIAARIGASLVAATLALAGVGGCSLDWSAPHVQPGAGGAGGDATTTTTTGAAGGGTGGSAATDCPASAPEPGAPCSGAARCEYGDDPRPSCRRQLECAGGAWSEDSCSCAPPTDALCPASPGGPAPSCPAGEVIVCAYVTGEHCGCADGAWLCPTTDPGCPLLAPDIGQPCGEEIECDYGSCALGTAIRRHCDGGTWSHEDPGCTNVPVSCR